MGGLLREHPFPAVTALLLAGAGAGWLLAERLIVPPVWWVVLLGVVLLAAWLELNRRESPELALNLFAAAVFLAGAGLLQVQLVPLLETPLDARFDGELHEVEGTVGTLVKRTGSGMHFLLEADKVDGEPLDRTTRVSVFVRLPEEQRREPGEFEDSPVLWGDRLSVVTSLERPDGPEVPGGFDARIWLWTQRAGVRAFVPKLSMVDRLNRSRGAVPLLVERSSHLLFGAVYEYLDRDRADLFISLIYGDKVVELDPGVREDFRRAGLLHILVVSGSQLSLLAGWLWLLLAPVVWFGRGWPGRLGAVVLLVAGLLWFALVTGFQMSIQRALLMALVLALNRFFFVNLRVLDSLALAAAVLVLFNPLVILSPSFQLSFGATLGLLLALMAAWPLMETLNRVERYFAATATATVGAQLAVAPLLAFHFNQMNPWGLFSNLFAIPLASFTLLIGSFSNLVWVAGVPLLDSVMALVMAGIVDLLNNFASWVAGLPFSALVVRTPPLSAIVLIYLACGVLGYWLWRVLRDEEPGAAVRFAGVGLLTLLTLWTGVAELLPPSGIDLVSDRGYRVVHIYRSGVSRLLLTEVPGDPEWARRQLQHARLLRARRGLTFSRASLVLGPSGREPGSTELFLPGSEYLGNTGKVFRLGPEEAPLGWIAYPEDRLRPNWVLTEGGLTVVGVGEDFRWGEPELTDRVALFGSPGRLMGALEEFPEERVEELSLVVTSAPNPDLKSALASVGGMHSASLNLYDLSGKGWTRLPLE